MEDMVQVTMTKNSFLHMICSCMKSCFVCPLSFENNSRKVSVIECGLLWNTEPTEESYKKLMQQFDIKDIKKFKIGIDLARGDD